MTKPSLPEAESTPAQIEEEVLDFYHASHHDWPLGRSLKGEHSKSVPAQQRCFARQEHQTNFQPIARGSWLVGCGAVESAWRQHPIRFQWRGQFWTAKGWGHLCAWAWKTRATTAIGKKSRIAPNRSSVMRPRRFVFCSIATLRAKSHRRGRFAGHLALPAEQIIFESILNWDRDKRFVSGFEVLCSGLQSASMF